MSDAAVPLTCHAGETGVDADMGDDFLRCSMDGILVGAGWYHVECDGQQKFRWFGPQSSATIHLDMDRRVEHRVNVAIHLYPTVDILQSLHIEADGVDLPLTIDARGVPAFATCIIPKDLSHTPNAVTIVKLSVRQTIGLRDAYENCNDSRRVGLAVQSIWISPLSRPLFIVQKYFDPGLFDGMQFLSKHPNVRDLIIQGAFPSAYDFYQAHRDYEYEPRLYESFDERPGDLSDIVRALAQKERGRNEAALWQEIERLKRVAEWQGHEIRILKDLLAKARECGN